MKLARLGVAVALCAAATLAVQPAPAHADATRAKQWHLGALKVAEAQKYSQGQGVTVAVIDTGVDANHPDLRDNVLAGTDLVPGGSGDGHRDTDGHGTAMAGLIAAHGHGTNAGALGIAPKAKILPIRVVGKYGADNNDGLVQGIDFAVTHGAKVINFSLAGGGSPDLRDAVDRARAADIVIVAAVGNTGQDLAAAYPAGADGVLTVGATNRSGNLDSVSLTAAEVNIAAPGAGITSTARGGGYRAGTGTSDSTAIVSGAVALVRAKYPDLSADEVIHRLTATATDKGPSGRDDQYGYGALNLVAALTADVPPPGQANATASAPPASSPPTTAAAAPVPDTSSDGTLIVVVRVLLALLVALIIAGVVWYFVRRRRRTG